MLHFFAANWGTILIGLLVAAAVVLILAKLWRDHKKGRSSCGCNCSQCPSSGMCHANQADQALPKGRLDHAASEKTP